MIEDVEKNNDDIIIKLSIPTKCPFCNADTEIRDNDGVKTLHCTNKNCDGLIVNKIDHYFGKKGLDVKGISKATIEKLIDWGWVETISDMYQLRHHEERWINMPGFGKLSVYKILQAIDDSCKNVQLDKFISALGIPLIGQAAAKQLAKHFKTWDSFMGAIEDNTYKWTLKGFGYEMIKAMYCFDYEEAKHIAKNFIIFEEPKEETVSSTLEGKTFVITGKLALGSRDKAKEMIEAAGGKVASAVSGKTNYLVNNDSTSESAKNKKAKELGVQIITEQELLEMIGH
jgi:DNA ligase (NAD+)